MFRSLSGAALLAAVSLGAYASNQADIRWTSFGVPHIQAADEQGLGYGIGYAYARDNLCLLEDELLTARGERSRYFGQNGRSSAELGNLPSDLFFRWLNTDDAISAFWAAQPADIQALLNGYVAGFNRYLSDKGASLSCRGAAWVQPITKEDMVRLIRRLLVEGGIGRFPEALLAAAPPSATDRKPVAQMDDPMKDFAANHGSNAIAVGGERTENGKGRLLGNPHFPWSGALRFYQMHLTIPGKLDVMGASLPGLPVVNIGFNQHLAWTHTVDSSSHFTLHRLQLDPVDPTRYVVDGVAQPMCRISVTVEVLGADGELSTVSKDIYETEFGPLVNWPGMLDWDKQHAYALKDANLHNDRVLRQWYAMNQATDVVALRESIRHIQGIPWVNTLAADDKGDALYLNGGVIPHVPVERLAQCADQRLVEQGLPGLDGSRRFCDWQMDEGAAQNGIVAGAHLPVLLNRSFVQNSNDSAWLSNPATPLTGYSPLVSREGKPLGARARFALAELAGQSTSLTEDFLQALVTGNRVYLAEQTLDDLKAFCASRTLAVAAKKVCERLTAWDRTANLQSDAAGVVYFQQLMLALQKTDVWREPFDPNDPVNTPRGIRWQDPVVAAKLEASLREIAGQTPSLPAQWGQLQSARHIPIPGGSGKLGVYSAIESSPAQNGHLEVQSGSSYIQLVSFDDNGPVAKGVLAFSQSSEPGSPHSRDQTELFSRQQWLSLPFTRAQIDADPKLRILRLLE
jgi:acyl-homoserine-lactone acylase